MSPDDQIKHLIIADDDEDDQMLLKEAIQEYSDAIDLTVISDGKQLINFLNKDNSPDLILLDLNMPYKNGTECLMEIRANESLRHIPVVILSTSRNVRDIELCFNFGANLFFTKPCSFLSLKILIRSILSIDWASFKTISSKQKFIQISTSGITTTIEEMK
jgi:CheY-like chemotaxis protein